MDPETKERAPWRMSNRRLARSSPPPGTIDYEVTSLEDARAAHDVLPPGVDPVLRVRPEFWQARRRASMVTDRAMTGRSLEWVMQLHPALRPWALCDRFPRIVNNISASWDDIEKSLAVFDHLLNDQRPGRRGFPAEVLHELEALCEHRVELAMSGVGARANGFGA
jgi:hypothetical protein